MSDNHDDHYVDADDDQLGAICHQLFEHVISDSVLYNPDTGDFDYFNVTGYTAACIEFVRALADERPDIYLAAVRSIRPAAGDGVT